MKKRIRNITSSDIAKIAGVSRTTVSFVLNNKRDKHISEKTREKVLKVVEELGYQQDQKAVNLARKSRYKIGLLVDIGVAFHFSDTLLSIFFEAMRKKCKRHRDRLLYIPFNFDNKSSTERIFNLDLDAVIVLFPKLNDRMVTKLRELHLPFVIWGSMSDLSVYSVDVDNVASARNAVEYLIREGFKKIAMISHAPKEYLAAKQRIDGYVAAMNGAGLKIKTEWLLEGRFNVESGYYAAEKLWQLKEKPEAIFAGNDEIAVGVMNFLSENNVTIPDDISIIGFDDAPLSEYLYPALTTIAIPGIDLGNACMDSVYALLEGKKPKKTRIILPSQIVIRESVKRAFSDSLLD